MIVLSALERIVAPCDQCFLYYLYSGMFVLPVAFSLFRAANVTATVRRRNGVGREGERGRRCWVSVGASRIVQDVHYCTTAHGADCAHAARRASQTARSDPYRPPQCSKRWRSSRSWQT